MSVESSDPNTITLPVPTYADDATLTLERDQVPVWYPSEFQNCKMNEWFLAGPDLEG